MHRFGRRGAPWRPGPRPASPPRPRVTGNSHEPVEVDCVASHPPPFPGGKTMESKLIPALSAFTLAVVLLVPAPIRAEAESDAANAAPPVYFQSIAELQQALASGKLSSEELTREFIERIQTLDQTGPKVNSVIELNPDALDIARARDRDRKAGKAHGLLFGIPVLVKDNIDSGDKMQTSAGSLALAGAPAPRDATVLAKLRAAGVVLLGKTNLSEWANFRSSQATSGWSGRGGLTHNPYVLDRNACGSSSGSGAAVSAGFVTA